MKGIITGIIIYVLLALAFVFAKRKRRVRDPTFRKAFLLVLVADTLGIVLFAAGLFGTNIDAVNREGEAENTVTKSLRVEIEGLDREQAIDLEVTGKAYTKEEEKAFLKACRKALPKEVLGAQEAESVSEDLNLPTHLSDNPTQIRWQQDDYEIMDASGAINRSALKEEGSPLALTASLSCGESEDEMTMNLILCPRKLTSPRAYFDEIKRLFSLNDAANPASESVALPASVGGRKIVWKKEERKEGYLLMILGLAAAFFLYAEEKDKEKKKAREEKRMLAEDYPGILNVFSMLLRAGLGTGRAWKLLTQDYEREKKRRGERPAFEAMIEAERRIAAGSPREEVYLDFGKICRDKDYEKFGNLLAENLRRGSGGLADRLAREAKNALQEEKAQARRRGEEAQTKLLLPMLLLLLIVLVIVMVPAFLSMQMS